MRIITPPLPKVPKPPQEGSRGPTEQKANRFLVVSIIVGDNLAVPRIFQVADFFLPLPTPPKARNLVGKGPKLIAEGGGLGVLESIKAAGLQKRTLAGWTTSPESGVPSSSSPPPLSGEQQPLAPRKQLDVAFTPTKSAKNMSRFGRFPKHPKACSCWALLRFVTCYANFPPGEGEG